MLKNNIKGEIKMIDFNVPPYVGKEKEYITPKKDLLPSVSLRSQVLLITGLAGFEPANVGVKVLCLTPWR